MRKNMNSHLLGEGSILHMRLMKQSMKRSLKIWRSQSQRGMKGRSKTQHTS
jgi:hypothetical protein